MKDMKQNKEIWVDVPGYEGYYQVSDEGNVKGLDRTVLTKNGQERFYKGKIMKSLFNKGYKQVGLSRDGKKERFLIHQLVAMAFLDHEPNGHTLVVDHVNGDTLNNSVENLQIVTQRQNLSTCYRANEDSFTSKFVGVSYHKSTNKWRSQIHFNNKKINLGYYSTEKDASTTYQKAFAELENGTFKIEDYRVEWTSNFKGVSYHKRTNKWEAHIKFNSKQIYLGHFNDELEASNTYQKALGELENGTFKIEDYRVKWTSKFQGVSWYKQTKKWIAKPTINGKRVYLGYHSSEEEAHQAILEYEAIQPIVKNC